MDFDDYRPFPTIHDTGLLSDGDVRAECALLRLAIKGVGTNEQSIIDILVPRSNRQRQQIKNRYPKEFKKDLIRDLKGEHALRYNFGNVIFGLLDTPIEFLCTELYKALVGAGTDENSLIEILCTRTSPEIAAIVKHYNKMYKRSLRELVTAHTSGDFRRVLNMILSGVRDPPGTINEDKVRAQTEALLKTLEAKVDSDDKVLIEILTNCSFAQLRLVFEDYAKATGHTLEQTIMSGMSGEGRRAMLAIVEFVQWPSTFFARCLFKSMKGWGTDDTSLIRILITRSEIDLGNIKEDYQNMYGRSLVSDVVDDTSGYYRKALVALIEGN